MLHSGHGSIPHILAPMVCLCESTTHEDGAIMHDDTLVASNFASGVQLLQHELSVSCVYAAARSATTSRHGDIMRSEADTGNVE